MTSTQLSLTIAEIVVLACIAVSKVSNAEPPLVTSAVAATPVIARAASIVRASGGTSQTDTLRD